MACGPARPHRLAGRGRGEGLEHHTLHFQLFNAVSARPILVGALLGCEVSYADVILLDAMAPLDLGAV